MSVDGQKQALEERRRRLKNQGWDLDIVDKVRLQMSQKKEDDRGRMDVTKQILRGKSGMKYDDQRMREKHRNQQKGYQTRRTRGGQKQKRR